MSNLVTVKKANRVLTVDVNNIDAYLSEGYDQINENGEVVKTATGGKNISLPEFNKMKAKYEELKSEIKEKYLTHEEHEQKVAELKDELKVMETENIRLDKLVKQLRGNKHN